MSLEILDAAGNVVNRYAGQARRPAPQRAAAVPGGPSDGTPPVSGESSEEEKAQPQSQQASRARGPSLPVSAGLNRFVWNWQVEPIPAYPELAAWEASRSYHVAPGRYQARLTVGGASQVQPFEVLPDPRKSITTDQEAERQALLATIKGETIAMLDAVQKMKEARSRLQGAGRNKRAAALDARIAKWLDLTVEASDRHFVDPSHSSERLDFNLLSVLSMVDNMDAPITSGLAQRVADVRAEWVKRRSEYDAIMNDMAGIATAAADTGRAAGV